MIRRNGDLLLEDEATRAARERRACLYRAAGALAAMCVLLGWLILDDDEVVAPAAEIKAPMDRLAIPPLPAISTAPVAPVVLPQNSGTVLAPPAEVAAVAPVPAPALPPGPDDREANSDLLPPGQAGQASEGIKSSDAASGVGAPIASLAEVRATLPEQDKDKGTVSAREATEPQGRVSGPAPAAGAADGYRIQLGQFVDMRSAAMLRDTLLRQGYAVRLQVRVAAGPYAQRKAAETALARMRGEHGLGGLVVVPPSGKGFIVQLGVFADSGNADELAARVKAWGYATQLHARVVVGSYPDQKSAQQALQRLQRERGTEGAVIVPSS